MRILIIEDDTSLVSGLKKALVPAGLAVDHETSGRGALGVAPSEAYSLIVLDLGLPDNGREVPILILTALKDSDAEAEPNEWHDYLRGKGQVALFVAATEAMLTTAPPLPAGPPGCIARKACFYPRPLRRAALGTSILRGLGGLSGLAFVPDVPLAPRGARCHQRSARTIRAGTFGPWVKQLSRDSGPL